MLHIQFVHFCANTTNSEDDPMNRNNLKKISFLLLVAAILAIGLGACSNAGGQGPAVSVEDPWVRASPMAEGNSAAYMILKNSGGEADALVGVSAGVSNAVELHEVIMEGDVMKMRPISGQRIEIPARGQAELKPGGLHIMLIGLNQALAPGADVDLTLHFEKSSDMQVKAPVRASGEMEGMSME